MTLPTVRIDAPPPEEVTTPYPRGMVHVAIYEVASGLWTGAEMTILPSTVEANTPEGCMAVEIVAGNPANLRLADGKLVDYIAPPPEPTKDYQWSKEHQSWIYTEAAALRVADAQKARANIAQLEAASLRAIREWMLTGNVEVFYRLKEVDDKISESRKSLG